METALYQTLRPQGTHTESTLFEAKVYHIGAHEPQSTFLVSPKDTDPTQER